ncbi:MAG: hypothetical protein KAI83_14120 [Thiomargarita sp.]|nr:hypothetical protein [Thiomargarita sp.]
MRNSVQSWDELSHFTRQLKAWRKQYRKQQSKQGGYHAKKIVDAVNKFSTIFKVKSLFKKMFLVLKVLLADPFLALIELIKERLNKKRKD